MVARFAAAPPAVLATVAQRATYRQAAMAAAQALITTLAAMLLTPFVVPFASIDSGRMPWLFRWMETPDVLLPGDLGYKSV